MGMHLVEIPLIMVVLLISYFKSNSSPLRVRLLLLMLQHRVASDAGRIARYVQPVELDSVGHVIIFSSPSPELVAEAVHFTKVVDGESAHSSEDIVVR